MRYAAGRWTEERWDRRTRRAFSVAGRSVGTSAAADQCICNLWNPDATRSIWVHEFAFGGLTNNSALDPLRFCRTTTLGNNPTTTVTPDLDNDFEREISPITAVTLRLSGFTTQPVLAVPELYRLSFPITGAPHALTWVFPRGGIRIPPGTGLALATTGAVAQSGCDITFRFVE